MRSFPIDVGWGTVHEIIRLNHLPWPTVGVGCRGAWLAEVNKMTLAS